MITFRDLKGIVVGLLIGGVLGLSLLISTPARAQVVGATLSGTITDNSGSSLPNAQVSIRNVATGVTHEFTSDNAGVYSAPNLDAGNYEVSVTATGFKKSVQPRLTLTVGAQQTLNFSLQVGELTQTVEVTTEAPIVQLTSSSVGDLRDAASVVELPLNGRDWGALANLSPGVAAVQVQQQATATVPKGNRGYGNQMTIAGTRPQENNYRLDGVSIVDYSGGTPASVIGQTLGVDAIAEFSVTTSNHSAEYGRTSGGVINAITKAGTNQFHGDLYFFNRDEGYDARSALDAPNKPLPPYHRDQYGASVGGPILKNKTFFFTNIELYRQVKSVSGSVTVPSADAINGFVTGANNTVHPGTTTPLADCSMYNDPSQMVLPIPGTSDICVSKKIQPYLPFYFYPTLPPAVASGPNPTSDTKKVSTLRHTVQSENYYTARIDHTINSKNSMNGSFFIDTATFSQPDAYVAVLNGNTSRRTMVTANETHMFSPTLVNNLRIGYSRQHMVQNNFLSCPFALACDTSGKVSSVPGRPAPALTDQAGLTNFNGGAYEATVNSQPWNSYQLYDDAFLTKGTHSMKFGLAIENMRHGPSNVQTLNGSWFFNSSIAAFLENIPSQLRMPASIYGYPQLRQSLFGGYFQDDWRIRPNLTINLGLRYEAATVLSEPHNNIQNLATISSINTIVGNPYIHNPTLRNFEPRLGFAWDPFKDGKTSVRGAFGVFDILPLSMEFFTSSQQTAPLAGPLQIINYSNVTANSPTQGLFPTMPASLPASPGVTPPTEHFFENNPKRNYVMVWNMNVQRQLTADTSVTVGYVGNHGVHMAERFGTMNMAKPAGLTSAGLPYWPINTGTSILAPLTPVFNTVVTSMVGMLWDGDSTYHALEASVNKKFSHGIQGQLAYTWGNNTDTSSATTISDPYLNSTSTLYWFCKACRRGPSDFNIAQKLSANLIYDLPSPKFGGAFGSYVVGGWEVGTIITATTGTPFTPLIAGDPLGTNATDSPLDNHPDYLPGCNPVNANYRTTLQYINLSCFTLPKAPSGSGIACRPFKTDLTGTTCANLDGNAGRNMLTGPGLFNMDFSVIKNTKFPRISENFNIQFRVEMFNFLNHVNWQIPLTNPNIFNQNGSSAGGGALDTESVPYGRDIQFGLKMIF